MAMVPVETSARHVHVSRADLDVLFGTGYQLINKKDLSQPGQFACRERVQVVGPRGELTCTILGAERPDTQVELSVTDARAIGITAPLRESGDIANTPGATIVGTQGTVILTQGVIVAKRHIHMTPIDAQHIGVADKQIVGVQLAGPRGVTFHQTVVRVSTRFAMALHIDTDEANAAGGAVIGEIV